jgi:hypothetical protein
MVFEPALPSPDRGVFTGALADNPVPEGLEKLGVAVALGAAGETGADAMEFGGIAAAEEAPLGAPTRFSPSDACSELGPVEDSRSSSPVAMSIPAMAKGSTTRVSPGLTPCPVAGELSSGVDILESLKVSLVACARRRRSRPSTVDGVSEMRVAADVELERWSRRRSEARWSDSESRIDSAMMECA